MQVTTSRTISPRATANILQNDFSAFARELEEKRQNVSLQPFTYSRVQIIIGDFLPPLQNFSLRESGNSIFVENFPKNSFPKIKIVLEKKYSKVQVKQFDLRPSDKSVEGGILHTNLLALTFQNKEISFTFKDLDNLDLSVTISSASLQDEKQMLFDAKLFRKLGFIEEFFKSKFSLPDNITPQDIIQIELLYRAITEGDFSNSLSDSITIFNYKLKKEDLENLSIPKRKSFTFEFNEDLLVLGKFFSTGKVTIRAEKASVANPRILKNFVEGQIIPNLRLKVFDYQVNYCFEKYANSERLLKSKQKLEQYKNSLRKFEPEYLVNLLDEPLSEVNAKAAVEIINGWLQFYDFPDRYTIGEPILEKNQWRVPIWLTYPNDKGIWLEDAFVNSRTGSIKISSSPEELRQKGWEKAKEVFSLA